MVLTSNDLARLAGTEVCDDNGNAIGLVGRIYLDAGTGDPQWVTIRTGPADREVFVPLRGAQLIDGRLAVGYPGDRVVEAPHIDTDGPLTEADREELDAFYGRR